MCENDIKENKESSPNINVRCGTSYWGFLGRVITILVIVAIGVMIYRNLYVEKKTYWEDNIKVWLNEMATEKGINARCKSVTLLPESLYKYTGYAEFDNGKKVIVLYRYDLWSGEGYMSCDNSSIELWSN